MTTRPEELVADLVEFWHRTPTKMLDEAAREWLEQRGLLGSKAEVPEADDEMVERLTLAINQAVILAIAKDPDCNGSEVAARAALRALGKGAVEKPLPEFKCPACGATTRARMADYPYKEPS
jgi:hypothetical protein